ncbi:hypothetical protein [Methylocaldum sp.]|uniref:hypothetical protein n=1 Tax=Methylocaldum sp. TaxID=1969727 RepID=UPI002D6D65CD|nr:hypothetical protein [Methylocaldum sp.]HYE36626.1 hypothetical protein [Methylocaldum sp.]
MFGWFKKNKELDVFAKTLAQDIAKRYPPAMDSTKEKKISVNRLSRILEDSYNKAQQYKQANKLGVYRKARLGNNFRWELKELGYSSEFIDTATEGLVVYLSRK